MKTSALLFLLAACTGGDGHPSGPQPKAPATERPAAGATPAADAPAAAVPGPPASPDQVAARVIQLVNAQDATASFVMLAPGMKEKFPVAKVGEILSYLLAKHGRMLEVTPLPEGAGAFHVRAERGDWRLDLALNDKGELTMLKFGDLEKAPPVARSTQPLGLPFRGEWLVGWGGDTKELNHHIDFSSQRRAADLLVADEAGSTHRGDGKRNDDYYAYGKEVLAVADGKVVTVVDGVEDNVPGEMNKMFVPGNLVVIEHEAKVYSAYAHLIPGKIRVRVGQRVKRGQVIGACGNTGNSSEAHLHFQLMDGPRFENSWGVEAVFADVDVTREGARARQASYSFRKDDRVAAPSSR